MEWCANDDVHGRNAMTETGQPRPPGGAPDPVGLTVAEKTQERLRPVEVIHLGSRAAEAWTFGNTRLRLSPDTPGKSA